MRGNPMPAGRRIDCAVRRSGSAWPLWGGIAGVVAVRGTLIGFGARPARADDTGWNHIFEADALPYLAPSVIAADPAGVYALGTVSLGPAFAVGNQLMVQKLDGASGNPA